jgi:nucleoside-diphosphate-sugar epimerase
VIQFLGFDAAAVRRDVEAFGGRTSQYVFISSTAVYQRPPPHYRVTEATPLSNPRWEYARRKIEAEVALAEAGARAGLPWTVVRPSYTYGDSWIPTTSGTDYTVVWRMRRNLEVPVPGDGTSLWTLTHASDLARGVVGLLGRSEALGEAFHITSDEVLCWNQIFETIARVLGVEPRLVHVPSDVIARIDPRRGDSLLGDKAWSLVFDNSKLRSVLPGFRAQVDFQTGVARSIRWLEADPARQRIDANESVERILAAWRRAMAALEAG